MIEETCDRCGATGPGRRRIFFEHGRFARKFHCIRCLRWTRIYGVIGLSLLLCLLGAVLAALSRLRH